MTKKRTSQLLVVQVRIKPQKIPKAMYGNNPALAGHSALFRHGFLKEQFQ